MAFVTVASIDLDILVAGAAQNESTVVGAAKRAFAGNMRSSIRARKRAWKFTVGPVTQSQHNTLRSAVEASSGIVNCSGDALGATISCLVTIGDADYVQDGVSFLRRLDLVLQEV